MTESFADFLARRGVDSDTLLHATRAYLAARTDDLTPREMHEQLVTASTDPDSLDSALEELEADPEMLEEICFALMTAAWETPGERERVQNAVENAKGKLPIVEAAILAMAGMYAVYLVKTGGVKETERTVKQTAEGSFEETTRTKFWSATGPLSAIVKLFGDTSKDDE